MSAIYFELWDHLMNGGDDPDDDTFRAFNVFVKDRLQGRFNPCWTHPRDPDNASLMHLCVSSGNRRLLGWMLDLEFMNTVFYLSPVDSRGNTPLRSAKEARDMVCVGILLRAFDAMENNQNPILGIPGCRLPFLSLEDQELREELRKQPISEVFGYRNQRLKLRATLAVRPTRHLFADEDEVVPQHISELREACLSNSISHGLLRSDSPFTHTPHYLPLATQHVDDVKNDNLMQCLFVAAKCRNWAFFFEVVYHSSFCIWQQGHLDTWNMQGLLEALSNYEGLHGQKLPGILEMQRGEFFSDLVSDSLMTESGDGLLLGLLLFIQIPFNSSGHEGLEQMVNRHLPPDFHELYINKGNGFIDDPLMKSTDLLCMFMGCLGRLMGNKVKVAIEGFLRPLAQEMKTAATVFSDFDFRWFDLSTGDKVLKEHECMRSTDVLSFVINDMLSYESLKEDEGFNETQIQHTLLRDAHYHGADLTKLDGVPDDSPLAHKFTVVHRSNNNGLGFNDTFIKFPLFELDDLGMFLRLARTNLFKESLRIDFDPDASAIINPDRLDQTELHTISLTESEQVFQNSLSRKMAELANYIHIKDSNGDTFLHHLFSNPVFVNSSEESNRMRSSVFEKLKAITNEENIKRLFREKNNRNETVAFLLATRERCTWEVIRDISKTFGGTTFDSESQQGNSHISPAAVLRLHREVETEPFKVKRDITEVVKEVTGVLVERSHKRVKGVVEGVRGFFGW